MIKMNYPIGTRYIHYAHKNKNPYIIVDILTTISKKTGRVVSACYLVEQEVMGQVVTDKVGESTVTRSIWKYGEIKGD